MANENPIYSPFFGVMGAAAAIIFSGKIAIRKKKMEEFANFSLVQLSKNSPELWFVLSNSNPFFSFVPKFSARSCLRNSQVRNGNCSYECDETRTHYEIDHPGCHGWYYRYLRIGGGCAHCWSSRRSHHLLVVQVSSTFHEVFDIMTSHVTTEKKINDHNPLHSH
jgi:hypothetical protein